jgi:hypothetical protein
MAAEWHYVANQKQAGPVELSALQQMLRSGMLSGVDLVFGPGLSEWTPAGQVPALVSVLAGSAGGMRGSGSDPYGANQTLNYRGVDTAAMGISPLAQTALVQTKPWVRFVAVMFFIGAGLTLVGGLFVMLGSAMGGSAGMSGIPAAFGFVYVLMSAFYFFPALYLNRYASRIGDLMRTGRMGDLEQALMAQKSFWRLVGIVMLVILCLYAVIAAFR